MAARPRETTADQTQALGAAVAQTHVTPVLEDVVFYVAKDLTVPQNKIYKYGDSYPNKTEYPDHRLIYVSEPNEANVAKFYYASDRITQEAYNFEFSQADIGSNKFNTVVRTYLIPRKDFSETLPAAGSPMSREPDNRFSADYVLTSRDQKRSGDKLFDSLYVVEQRTYFDVTPLPSAQYDPKSGETNYSVRRYYYRGQEVEGTPIEDLVDDPDNAYWKGDGNNVNGRKGDSISENWFVVDESLYTLTDIEFVAYEYDDTLDAMVKVTRKAVPRGTVVGSVTNGKLVEVRPHNTIYDFVITSEIVLPGGGITALNKTIPAVFSYNFPPKLNSARFVWAEAWAVWETFSEGVVNWSRDEGQYLETDITDPGTVSAAGQILRRFTYGPPASVPGAHNWKAKAVSFGIVSSWHYAGAGRCQAQANAAQYHIPPTIHGAITINLETGSGTIVSPGSTSFSRTLSIPATSGSIPSMITIDVDVIPRRFGIYETQIKQVSTAGVYS